MTVETRQRSHVHLRSARAWVRFLVIVALSASCTSQGAPSPARATQVPPETVAPTASSAPTETQAVETEPTVTATPEGTPAPTAAPTPPNPFGRHDTPPGGVAAQLGFLIPNELPCSRLYRDLGPGQWARTAEALEVPGRTRICLLGFSTAEPVELSVTTPDGTVIPLVQPTTELDGSLAGWLTRLPGDPLGTYAVHAQQGPLAADTSVEVIAPIAPRGVVVPDPVHAGDSIQIWLGGLALGSATPAYLYRLELPGGWQFIADLGAVSIDDRGFGMIALSSQSSDPTGPYRVEAGTTVRFSLLP